MALVKTKPVRCLWAEVARTLKNINLALHDKKKSREDDEGTLFCLSLVQKFNPLQPKFILEFH